MKPPPPPPRPCAPREYKIKDYSELTSSISEIIGALSVAELQFKGSERQMFKVLIEFLQYTRSELKKVPEEGTYYRKN